MNSFLEDFNNDFGDLGINININGININQNNNGNIHVNNYDDNDEGNNQNSADFEKKKHDLFLEMDEYQYKHIQKYESRKELYAILPPFGKKKIRLQLPGKCGMIPG